MKTDYIIQDYSHASHWPGLLPYRGDNARQGYKTLEDAQKRVRRITHHYAATKGGNGPDLRVYERVSRPGLLGSRKISSLIMAPSRPLSVKKKEG